MSNNNWSSDDGMGWLGLGTALYSAYNTNKSNKLAAESSEPLPTYYQPYQSEQQESMYGMMQPTAQNLFGGNMNTVPALPQYQGYDIPQTSGGYNVPQTPQWGGYNVPDTSSMMPQGNWYGNLDPNIKAGIEDPYMQGMDMMKGQLSGVGMLGNQRAGMSGAAADVFGEYMQHAAPSMAQTGWGMMAPGLQQGWQANLQQNMTNAQMPYNTAMQGWQGQLGANQYGAGLENQGWQAQLAQNQAGSQIPYQSEMQGWGAQNQQNMMPYQAMMGMMPGTYSDLLLGNDPTISPAMTAEQQAEQQKALQAQQTAMPQQGNVGNGHDPFANNPWYMGP